MRTRTRLLLLLFLAAVAPAWGAEDARPGRTTYQVPMRDGTKLSLVVVLPEGKGPWPVVLTRTPYNKTPQSLDAALFTSRGYARAVEDLRGRFASEGQDEVFLTDAWGELQDGYDTIEWIAKQPWCNGKVGMFGASACGITQLLAAGAAPPALRCCHVMVAPSSLYHYCAFTGGEFRKADVENWIRGTKLRPENLTKLIAHPDLDDLWKTVDLGARAGQVKVPMMHIGGWYDLFQQGTIEAFTSVQHNGGPGAKGNQVLVMGPWVHGCVPAGQLQFPLNALRNPGITMAPAFFERWLGGKQVAVSDAPVHYYVMGACGEAGAPGNEWRTAPDWPVPATPTPLYLDKGGKAGFTAPAAEQASLSYKYDPADPVPTVGGGNLTIERGPMDQRRVEGRPDVLLFTTDPLEKPIEVTGRLTAVLYVSSDAPDTDFTAKLTDVYPDGRSMLVADGILQMRHRDSLETETLMQPGKVYPGKVDLWSTSIVFNKGHRIRVAISSSNAPRFEPNPNTGARFRANTEKRVATNTLYLDKAHPSHLLLPVR